MTAVALHPVKKLRETAAMREKPSISGTSAGLFYGSAPMEDDSRVGRTETDAEQRGQTADGVSERSLWPSLSAQAFDVLPAELEDLRLRQQPSLNQSRPYSMRRGSAHNCEIWRDQLLAGIEDLASELKSKVAHFALFCAVQSSDETSVRANASAVAWMQDAIEDIAATALGMEMESREVLLRASQADILRASETEGWI